MTALPELDLAPHDLDAERAVLGSVMIRGHVTDVLGLVQPADMFLPAHRAAFDAVLDLASRRQPIDAVTVGAHLKASGALAKVEGGEAWVLGLYGAVPTAENGPHYARVVRDKARARRLIGACLGAIGGASKAEPDEVVAELRVALSGLGAVEGGPVAIGADVDAYLTALEARQAKKVGMVVPSGIQALDNVVRGHRPGQAVVVAGRPGTGKSAHTFSTLVRAARNHGVPGLMFSLEMTREELMDRAMALETGIDGIKLQDGELDYDAWKKNLHPASKVLRGLPLWLDDRKLSIEQIVAEATRWREKNPGELAVVAVDYLGLIRSTRRAENRQQEVSEWMRELKLLAGDLRCVVIVVSQLNRESVQGGTPRRPVLSDLRESGAIEQDADTVIFTWRDGNISELIVAKNRGRPIGVASVRWDGPRTAYFDDEGPEFTGPPNHWTERI